MEIIKFFSFPFLARIGQLSFWARKIWKETVEKGGSRRGKEKKKVQRVVADVSYLAICRET